MMMEPVIKAYGQPLRCPKCPDKHYYGLLRLPDMKARQLCENCGTLLVTTRSTPEWMGSTRPTDGLSG